VYRREWSFLKRGWSASVWILQSSAIGAEDYVVSTGTGRFWGEAGFSNRPIFSSIGR
jgi:hypothetical protein